MMTVAPYAANSRAAAAPTPLVPPVMMETLFWSSFTRILPVALADPPFVTPGFGSGS